MRSSKTTTLRKNHLRLFLGVTLLLFFFQGAGAQTFKVYISADMEGIAGVVSSDQVVATGSDYPLARQWMTQEVNAAIRGALDAGATDITVNDSHGNMQNIIISELDPSARLISGVTKPLGMMQGIDETFDAAIFIGYHAGAGARDAVLDHTYSGAVVYSLKVNGLEVPELGLNALIAGHFNVPVVFVSGDRAACEEAKEILGSNVTVLAVKDGIGRYAANSMSLQQAQTLTRQKVKKALQDRNEKTPFRLAPPYVITLTYLRSSQADLATLIPGVKRLDARTVQITSDNILTGFQFLRALMAIGRYN